MLSVVKPVTQRVCLGRPYILWSTLLATLSLCLLSWGCPSISLFDQYAYAQATNLKVDALALMDMATDSVGLHQDAIDQLQIRLDKAYEYEKGRPKNEISAEMWSLMISPDRHLLGGFLKRWQEEKILGHVFVDEAKRIIAKGLDQIIGLESAKIKPEEASAAFKALAK
jgi:hypothetical protein